MELRSDVEKLTYSGVQEILLNVTKPIDVVLVHIKEKKITGVELKDLGSYKGSYNVGKINNLKTK